MRIAFVVNTFPAVSETFILNQITGLIDRGHHVDIHAFSRPDTSLVHDDVVSYELIEHTHYPSVVPRGAIARLGKAVCLAGSALLRDPHGVLRTLNIARYGRESASLRLLCSVAPWLGNQYDIIHCHFGPAGFTGLRMREHVSRNAKVVVSFHGYDMTSYLREHGSNTYQNLFQQIDCALPISDYWKRKLLDLGCPSNRVAVHRMGVDFRKLVFRPRRIENNEPVKILTTARFVEKKGLSYAIRAVASLLERHKQVEYSIVGDGPLRDECLDLVGRLRVQDSVHILGWKSQEELSAILQGSHIFLCPSVTAADGDQEGIPVSLMEAMAVGLPVVSTHHSGIPELVQDCKTGFLVPERDVDALAERLDYLVAHPEIWPDLGGAGRAHVETNYNIEKLNDRLVEVYQNLLQDTGAGEGL